MQPLKKGMLILGGPLAVAAMFGGAAAFASSSGGAQDPVAPSHFRSHQAPGPSTDGGDGGHDGTGCPHDGGAGGSGEGAVSPTVY